MTLHQFKVMDNSLILLCFLGVEFTMVCMDCVGYFKFPPCCIGEKLDVAANKCVSCPQGLLGEDCTHICNIPFNGHRCSLGGCFCTRTSCSLPADVCSSSPVAKSTPFIDRETLAAVNTSYGTETNRNSDASNPLVYIVPVTVMCTLIVIMILCFFLHKRYKSSCECLKWKHQLHYEEPIRVYENRISTNIYDFPEENMTESRRSSESNNPNFEK
uniref:Uncharacterized protein LOC111102405 isoform X1 n=1 Tax=Crassostrea virginica TaxID=6565 RepID=A0A8B8AI21_CRAVI|nr:uncharacterized protein LOC111102405 isoform X1 [Crassostrea virginica]